jgi:hypothetical protein
VQDSQGDFELVGTEADAAAQGAEVLNVGEMVSFGQMILFVDLFIA